MSVRMIKICDESLIKPLFNIFPFSLETGRFLSNWKRGNIVLVHKKGNNNYIIIDQSLLPIFSKIYEKYIYDALYNYFEDNVCFLRVNPAFEGDPTVVHNAQNIQRF